MSRSYVADPKRPFACQIKESDLKWLRAVAIERSIAINSLVELGINLLKAQLLREKSGQLDAIRPKPVQTIVNDFKQLSDD